jgi:hypothetical protein
VDPLLNVKSVIHHLIQKENSRSMLNMRSLEGRVVVGNDDVKNIEEKACNKQDTLLL